MDLSAYLREVAPKPWRYGETDCAQFARGWVECNIGVNPAAALALQYSDFAGSRDILRRAGGIVALGQRLSEDVGLIETGRPRAGDVGIVLAGRRLAFGICVDPGTAGSRYAVWAVKSNRSLTIAPMPHRRAWSVRARSGVGAESIGALILSFLAFDAAIGLTTVVGSITVNAIVGTIVLTAASIGAQYAIAALMKPSAPKAAQQQQVIRQATGPRIIHYGVVKVSGTAAFWEAKNGAFYRLIMTGAREIDSVLEHWLGSTINTVSATYPYPVLQNPPGAFVKINTRRGLNTETAYAELIAAFPSAWTEDHTLDGISTALITCNDAGKYTAETYPNGLPSYRQVIRASKLFDPREYDHDVNDVSTWEWSDNSGIAALDFLTYSDGYGFSKTDADMASFSAFADLCDEYVGLNGGGVERRYRISGSWSMAEARKEPLRRILATCDGEVSLLPSGKIGIVGGKYETPVVTIDNKIIIRRTWEYGQDATELVNEIKPIFLSPAHDYQETEASPWRDESSILADGLISQQLDLPMVFSHSQAQRIAKIAGRRINSPLRGTLKCNLGGLLAYQQRIIRVVDTTLLIDAEFIVEKFDFEFNNDSVGVTLRVVQINASDWDWDGETEEGPPPPIPPDTTSSSILPTPVIETLLIDPVEVADEVTGGQLHLTWELPERLGLIPEIRYRNYAGGAYGPYQMFRVDAEESEFISGIIANDGTVYELQVRFVGTFGTGGPWSEARSVIATTWDGPSLEFVHRQNSQYIGSII